VAISRARLRQFDRRQLGEGRQTDRLHQFRRAAVQCAQHLLRSPELEGIAELALQSDTDILAHRKMGEHRGNLERASESHAGDRGRRAAGDVAPLEVDLPRRRREEMGKQVEARRLAGTVRPDEGVNGVATHMQIDVLDRDEALELLRQPFRLENYLFFGHPASLRCGELIEALRRCPALAPRSCAR
jgi:hypothetical protein